MNRIIEKDPSREPLRVLMFTAGMAMVLTNGVMLLFSSNTMVTTTRYSGMTTDLGPFILSTPRAISFLIALTCTAVLYLFLQKSETGRALRATSQNRSVAKLMGIHVKLIYAIAFGIGIGLVGISASLLVPYFPFSPSFGLVFGFRSFVIVVLGGKGSVPGALAGGLLVGVIEKLGGLYLSDAYAQALLFLLFVLILLFRPSGLLGKETDG